jgi:hypothetical protein
MTRILRWYGSALSSPGQRRGEHAEVILRAIAPELFSRDFTIDTGQIVNQGRARGLFRGLVSLDDEPMTPREERGYGQVSLSSARGCT